MKILIRTILLDTIWNNFSGITVLYVSFKFLFLVTTTTKIANNYLGLISGVQNLKFNFKTSQLKIYKVPLFPYRIILSFKPARQS